MGVDEKSKAIKEFAERFRKELFDEIRKTIWNINLSLEYEQNKTYAFICVCSCIKNKLEELTEQTTFEKIEHNSLCETETYKGGE